MSPPVPGRRRPWRVFLLTVLVGGGLALGVGWVLRHRLPGYPDLSPDHFPPKALADYVPSDSGAVLTLDLRAMRESPVVRRHLEGTLRQLVGRGEGRLPWVKMLGLDPLADVDALQISFAPESAAQPLWLVQGRFDPANFEVGPGKLRQKTVDRFRVYEYSAGPGKAVMTIAPAGDTLVFSETPGRVTGALDHASHPGPSAVDDPTFRALLQQVDRRQSLWFVASFKKLGQVAKLDSFVLELVLRPLMANAEGVHGGITCGDDLRAAFHFRAGTEEAARKLEELLRSACEVAGVSAGLDRDLGPLLRLLGTGEVTREGRSVSLRCRLSGEQLAE